MPSRFCLADICDDCCSNAHDISLQAQVYQIIKDIDPFHVTIGAVNCGNSWMFTDQTPSWLASEQSDGTPTLPVATQPALQLSLDVVMQENYDVTLAHHAKFGTWAGGVSMDGFYRHGVSFEPLLNCPSPNVGTYGAPVFMRTAMWEGLVTAGMRSNLVFVYDEDMVSKLWREAAEAAVFATQVQKLLPALEAPFGTVDHPSVVVLGESSTAIARAWSASPNCSFVVAVNADESRTQAVSVRLSTLGVSLAARGNATRVFDAKYSVKISNEGVFTDEIGAGQTNVYRIGQTGACNASRFTSAVVAAAADPSWTPD